MSRDADPFVGRCARCSKPNRLFRSVLAPASASTPRAIQSTVALASGRVARGVLFVDRALERGVDRSLLGEEAREAIAIVDQADVDDVAGGGDVVGELLRDDGVPLAERRLVAIEHDLRLVLRAEALLDLLVDA